jgi:hypothetical protein
LIFYYASVLFLSPEVFTEQRMRPGQHGHKEHATGCPGGMAHTGGFDWTTVGRTRRGGEYGNNDHRQAVSGSDSDDGHWAGRWARQDFCWVGRFQGGPRIWPMAI